MKRFRSSSLFSSGLLVPLLALLGDVGGETVVDLVTGPFLALFSALFANKIDC